MYGVPQVFPNTENRFNAYLNPCGKRDIAEEHATKTNMFLHTRAY